jgi:hypothetical protein
MAALEWRVPMVLHADHGAFALTALMHERLAEREVPWLGRCQRASDDRWYMPAEEVELRRDPDLVDVVRQLEVELAAATSSLEEWGERRDLEHRLLHGLRVVSVRVVIEINDDDDGKETVRVTGGTW